MIVLLTRVRFALKRQAGWRSFAEETGLIRSCEGNDFVKHAAADLVDIPSAQERVDGVAG
jgi:hypothetical protein